MTPVTRGARNHTARSGLNHETRQSATRGISQIAISPTALQPPGSLRVSPTPNTAVISQARVDARNRSAVSGLSLWSRFQKHFGFSVAQSPCQSFSCVLFVLNSVVTHEERSPTWPASRVEHMRVVAIVWHTSRPPVARTPLAGSFWRNHNDLLAPAGTGTEFADHPRLHLFGISIRITDQRERRRIIVVYIEQPWQWQPAHFDPASFPRCWVSFMKSAWDGTDLIAPPIRRGCTTSTLSRPPSSPDRCPARGSSTSSWLAPVRSRARTCSGYRHTSLWPPCPFKGYVCTENEPFPPACCQVPRPSPITTRKPWQLQQLPLGAERWNVLGYCVGAGSRPAGRGLVPCKINVYLD